MKKYPAVIIIIQAQLGPSILQSLPKKNHIFYINNSNQVKNDPDQEE
jgi:hypothetical protein